MQTMLMPDRYYNFFKFLALILLPASGALYFGLAQIWGLPNAEQVVGTVTVLETFLGLLLGLSTKAYNQSDQKYDGVIQIQDLPEKKLFSVRPLHDPEELEQKKEVLFRVEAE
jgi:hypothetical protein